MISKSSESESLSSFCLPFHSSVLKIGDKITIYFAKKEVEYEVLELKDSTKKEDATKMFKILSEKARELENERTE